MLPKLRIILTAMIGTCAAVLALSAGMLRARDPNNHLSGVPAVSRPLMRQAIVEEPEWRQVQVFAYTRRADELLRLRDLPMTPVRAVIEYAEQAQAKAESAGAPPAPVAIPAEASATAAAQAAAVAAIAAAPIAESTAALAEPSAALLATPAADSAMAPAPTPTLVATAPAAPSDAPSAPAADSTSVAMPPADTAVVAPALAATPAADTAPAATIAAALGSSAAAAVSAAEPTANSATPAAAAPAAPPAGGDTQVATVQTGNSETAEMHGLEQPKAKRRHGQKAAPHAHPAKPKKKPHPQVVHTVRTLAPTAATGFAIDSQNPSDNPFGTRFTNHTTTR